MPKPPKMKGWQVGLISVLISAVVMFLFWQLGYVKTDWRETEEEEVEEGDERRLLSTKSARGIVAQREAREARQRRLARLQKAAKGAGLVGHDQSSFIQT